MPNEDGARRWHLRSNTTGVGDVTFRYGNANTLPVPGDWDGNGSWTPGIVADDPEGGRRWYLKNSLTGGVDDLEFKYGNRGSYPVPADWDGNGTVTPGIAEN
ncbi:hypothetical protein [Micromonospora sp. CPCC 205556]|uniref:hypothetical protein n=1 Tax=Micromonospora sp. CPCC 205556 TaxID=3122398 RepID=UPI002FF2BD98